MIKNTCCMIQVVFTVLCFANLASAQTDVSTPLRQAKISVTIQKMTYTPQATGLPIFVPTPVCVKQGLINVYPSGTMLNMGDLALVQCDGEVAGVKVLVELGGALYIKAADPTKNLAQEKSTELILGWGDSDNVIPKASSATWQQDWSYFGAEIAPISTGAIVHGHMQAPEPSEFFAATVEISDSL